MTSSPTSIWVERVSARKNTLTSCLCVGAGGKHGVTARRVSAVRNRGWKTNQTAHLDAVLAGKPARLRCTLPPARSLRRHQWLSQSWSSWWGANGKSSLGSSAQGPSFFIRRHNSSNPLETEWKGRGGVSGAPSTDCREREGAVDTQWWGLNECVCVR